ncbi:MAG TPA: hypothetical protein VGE72_31745 [Azospirillum sp.]
MRRLTFVERTVEGYADGLAKALEDAPPRVRFIAGDALAPEVAARLRALRPDVRITTDDDPVGEAGQAGGNAPLVALFGATGEILSPHLAGFLDARSVHVVAPITNHYHRNKVLFLVSIPKAGTHLLFELAKAFGIEEGGECPLIPRFWEWPGHWFYLEYSNSHTAAPDFFLDTTRRRPFGNRDHPFARNPTLFIYRNPLDILVSEANYYHEDGKTLFSGYLAHLSYEERLLRLIDDPWLLGTLRDRIGKFLAWLDFGSVIPVSFEELVGPQGGGDRTVQLDLIWSLQLKLHVAGRPETFADRVFNQNSPTFRFGRIGAHRERLTDAARERLAALPQDFMTVPGYHDDSPFPRRADEFRRRMPIYSRVRYGRQPILEKADCMGHNIIRFDNRFVAVPRSAGPIDLASLPQSALDGLLHSTDLTELEHLIFLATRTT